MLTVRQKELLKAIIGEYTAHATPVASQALARNYDLGVSPATIRHDMARLEEEGYISRRHASAGSVPSAKGYRYYVESLLETPELPPEEQVLIQHLFHQVETELEEWGRLAASLLVRLAHNAALVTLPRTTPARFQHVELVALHEFAILLILILREARLKRQLITTQEAVSQEGLSTLANKLNSSYLDLTASQIAARSPVSPPLEQRVCQTVVHLMEQEDQQVYESPHVEGLQRMFGQPEFSTSQQIRDLLELLSERDWLKAVLPQAKAIQGVQVIIGGENQPPAMGNCSLVIAQYGTPHRVSGALGVLGPIRMAYGHTISAVRYLAGVMSRLLSDLYRAG
ncbi:MAG TPA: heat-inducible transcription repressor HrcA [Dehalococcoidia bacterium]|nr:heat-inducible transcription repressor HrcA [Dehalococcoidia bacterium]